MRYLLKANCFIVMDPFFNHRYMQFIGITNNKHSLFVCVLD